MPNLVITPKRKDALKDQILLVLADYKTCSSELLRSEGWRIEVANRIIRNLELVAKSGKTR